MASDEGGDIIIQSVGAIDDIAPADWDRIACPDPTCANPFVRHAFLSALEQSRSVCAEAGWDPHHLVAMQGDNLLGAIPVYAKGNSQGEYVFDHHWADAYHRAGGRYYPKLLCAVPFTPATGPRLLSPNPEIRRALAHGLSQMADKFSVSSAHVNYIEDGDRDDLLEAGFLHRIGEQYHWFNDSYESFDDFLAALSSRKRKAIRRERREAIKDVEIKHHRGDEITEQHWDAFWRFYQDTGARKWGTPYLTRSFFSQIAETMGEDLLLICAESNGRTIAGALNFIGGDALYGRYWGCVEDVPFLHFEICYYQAIDFAIAAKLSRVEAGAQGDHKIARGYQPVATHSAHYLADPSFRMAIQNYLESERDHTNMELKALESFMPFRKTSNDKSDRNDDPS